MPPPEFHKYVKKVLQAARRVDHKATFAQREAGNARIGRIHFHGIQCAIEWPKGSLRKGIGQDGKEWTRPMRAHYGRINRTTSPHDGDPVDFYLGDHPESQIVFVVSQLTERGDLDEHKVVLGTLNVAQAKKVYLDHYPDWWKDERLGEVRGYTMEQFKKWLETDNPVKNNWNRSSRVSSKAASCGLWRYRCPHCDGSNAFNGNPDTGHRFRGSGRCIDCGKFFSVVHRDPIEKQSSNDRPVREDARDPADCEDCPSCGASMERGGDGYCNRCAKPWPAVTKRKAS